MLFKGAYKLSSDPLIIGIQDYSVLSQIGELPKNRDITAFVHLTWNHARLDRMVRKKLFLYRLGKQGVNSFLMCNSGKEDRLRKSLGIKGQKSCIYIFTNENNYGILDLDKKYDAVYAAQIIPFKRIELAREIEKLFILTYTQGAGTRENDLYAAYPQMTHADFNKNWLDTAEKNLIYNQSQVGLCLSKEEGPMLASFEYMLAGLPVVSTRSAGGRDEYYDPEYTLIVDDNPTAIKNGVKELIGRKIDPNHIRQRTIGKLLRDRELYIDFIVDCIKKQTGKDVNPEELMKKLFDSPTDMFIGFDQLSLSIQSS